MASSVHNYHILVKVALLLHAQISFLATLETSTVGTIWHWSPHHWFSGCLLSFQLARHNKELQGMLKPGGTYGEGDEALEFYAKHTAQIEVGGLAPCQN